METGSLPPTKTPTGESSTPVSGTTLVLRSSLAPLSTNPSETQSPHANTGTGSSSEFHATDFAHSSPTLSVGTEELRSNSVGIATDSTAITTTTTIGGTLKTADISTGSVFANIAI